MKSVHVLTYKQVYIWWTVETDITYATWIPRDRWIESESLIWANGLALVFPHLARVHMFIGLEFEWTRLGLSHWVDLVLSFGQPIIVVSQVLGTEYRARIVTEILNGPPYHYPLLFWGFWEELCIGKKVVGILIFVSNEQ